jgi:hypothetical protein
MNDRQYFLKEIGSEMELELFLRLRYEGFCKSASGVFVNKNDNAIDINYYDRNSHHYGIFKNQDKKTEPVGYFRIVLEEPTVADQWVKNISLRTGLTHLTAYKPRSVFPCLGIYPRADLEQEFYTGKAASERAGEVSRFVIIRSERSVKLSLQIIKIAFAIALLKIEHAFVGCFSEHSKTYMKFGFRQCPGSSTFSFESVMSQKEGLILYCSSAYLTRELQSKCKIMQRQFLLDKCLAF